MAEPPPPPAGCRAKPQRWTLADKFRRLPAAPSPRRAPTAPPSGGPHPGGRRRGLPPAAMLMAVPAPTPQEAGAAAQRHATAAFRQHIAPAASPRRQPRLGENTFVAGHVCIQRPRRRLHEDRRGADGVRTSREDAACLWRRRTHHSQIRTQAWDDRSKCQCRLSGVLCVKVTAHRQRPPSARLGQGKTRWYPRRLRVVSASLPAVEDVRPGDVEPGATSPGGPGKGQPDDRRVERRLRTRRRRTSPSRPCSRRRPL